MNTQLKTLRRAANVGLYGSLAAVILTVIFHFSPWTFRQSPVVARWMLVAGIVLAVLAIVMVLMMIRKTTPRIRQLDTLEQKLSAYVTYISNLYFGTLAIVVMECLLIILMGDNSLLMVTMLLVLCLFLAYPNMYKMKNDLGLLEEEMTMLFGDAYIGDARTDAEPDLETPSKEEILAAEEITEGDE